MCGIASFWAREATLTRIEYDILLEGASLRGDNGVGIAMVNKETTSTCKWVESYSEKKEEILDFICSHMKLGSILLVNCRATPETELITNIEMLQPIDLRNAIFVHNGGVTDSIKEDLQKKGHIFTTLIDSECIYHAYQEHNFNMKATMEYLVGSFAFIMVDREKGKMYAVTSFNPLAHMYIKGYGYFYHSDNGVLEKVLKDLTGQTQDGVNVWEAFYHHYLEGYVIVETDLDSGFQFKQYYEPRFIHPVWDKTSKKEKVLVVASGGIDSGLTAFVLKKVGYDVEMIHFLYGQKPQECELWAVKKLGEKYDIFVRVIDLQPFYHSLPERGMLTSSDVEIQSGGNLIKSTVAWTSSRNLLFASMAITVAESMITSNEASDVFISSGWSQISEETGGYPDNSFKFNESLNEIKKYGCITGSHIHFLPVMQRILKTEEWALGGALGFDFSKTVSCDDPKMVDGIPRLCIGCGSTKLSMLASDRANVFDPRNFDEPREMVSLPMLRIDIENIIDRLLLSSSKKDTLRKFL